MFSWMKGWFKSKPESTCTLTRPNYECVVWFHDGSKRKYQVEADNHVDATTKCEKILCDGGIDRGEIKYILAQLP